MKTYQSMTHGELTEEQAVLTRAYESIKAKKLKLNMARGKPGNDQLTLSMLILDVLKSTSDCSAEDGLDCRNYGELKGIAEAKKLFSDYMGVGVEEILIVGSASLTFMYDCMARAMLRGVLDSDKPWTQYPKVKFLCPVPGYDRHFSICEFLNIEMINIPMYTDGPDMELVEKLVAEDETVKGMWCVPKFSNPLGVTYSDEVVRRLAGMKTKAKDFRIFWDNAYAMHFVYNDAKLLNILDECKNTGYPNRVYMFGSTNKITFPGAGVAFFAASKENIDFTEKQLSMQAISWDKMNMLRHVRFLKDMDGIRAHMEQHADLLKPRFDIVINRLRNELSSNEVGSFFHPDGGYFITYQAPSGCAKRIVSLCKEAGVVLTNAGATHPYGIDPDDSYIRIAPSFPSCDELESAMDVFCIAAKLAAVEARLY